MIFNSGIADTYLISYVNLTSLQSMASKGHILNFGLGGRVG